MPLEIDRNRIEPDITVLVLKGRITVGGESQQLQDHVQGLCASKVRKLVLDLAGADYVDSAGLGVLVFCYTIMKDAGGQLRLAAPNERVRELLHFTHLDQLLPVDPSTQEASGRLSAV